MLGSSRPTGHRAVFICGVTTTGFLETHLVALVVENGLSLYYGGLAFSVISACNGIALVIAGYMTDAFDKRLLLATIFAVRAGIYVVLLLAFDSSEPVAVLFVFSVVFGVVDYSVIPPVVSLVKAHYPHIVGLAMGLLLSLHSGGSGWGCDRGWIFESEGHYDMAPRPVYALGVATAAILLGVPYRSEERGRGRGRL